MTPINLNAVVAQLQALEPRHQEIIAELTKALASTSKTTISMPLSTWIDLWCEHLTNKGRSPRTVANYATATRPFITAFPCPTPIDLDTWLTLRRNKVSPLTLRLFAAALRNFFGYLAERGIPAMTPKDVPVIIAPMNRRKAPPPEDVAKLLSYPKLKIRSKALLFILIDSGPRISEVTGLRRMDCDLVRHQLHITKAKGNKQRTIPISPTTARVLEEYLKTHNSNYVFPGRRGISWNTTAVETHLHRLCAAVGIPSITPHQFRHFFATQAINTGANIRSVSEILGHESPSITMDVYCHTNPELNAREHADHSPLSKMIGKENE